MDIETASTTDGSASESSLSSPNRSRYGRVHKPKIIEDFFNTEDIFDEPKKKYNSSPSNRSLSNINSSTPVKGFKSPLLTKNKRQSAEKLISKCFEKSSDKNSPSKKNVKIFQNKIPKELQNEMKMDDTITSNEILTDESLLIETSNITFQRKIFKKSYGKVTNKKSAIVEKALKNKNLQKSNSNKKLQVKKSLRKLPIKEVPHITADSFLDTHITSDSSVPITADNFLDEDKLTINSFNSINYIKQKASTQTESLGKERKFFKSPVGSRNIKEVAKVTVKNVRTLNKNYPDLEKDLLVKSELNESEPIKNHLGKNYDLDHEGPSIKNRQGVVSKNLINEFIKSSVSEVNENLFNGTFSNQISLENDRISEDGISLDVTKVLKIISNKNEEDALNNSTTGDSKTKYPIKTYGNKRKSYQKKDVIESFGLPDEPIVPPVSEKRLPERNFELDVDTSTEANVNVNLDSSQLNSSWNETLSDLSEIKSNCNEREKFKVPMKRYGRKRKRKQFVKKKISVRCYREQQSTSDNSFSYQNFNEEESFDKNEVVKKQKKEKKSGKKYFNKDKFLNEPNVSEVNSKRNSNTKEKFTRQSALSEEQFSNSAEQFKSEEELNKSKEILNIGEKQLYTLKEQVNNSREKLNNLKMDMMSEKNVNVIETESQKQLEMTENVRSKGKSDQTNLNDDDVIILNDIVNENSEVILIENDEEDENLDMEKLKNEVDKNVLNETNNDTTINSSFNLENTYIKVEKEDDIFNETIDLKSKLLPEFNTAQMDYKKGDLVWARIGKYPYWPCLITNDPLLNNHIKYIVRRFPLIYFHVRFFGDNGRRSWVFQKDILPFQGRDDLDILLKKIKKKGKQFQVLQRAYQIQKRTFPRWDVAVQEAESVLPILVSERDDFFEEILINNKGGKWQKTFNKTRKRNKKQHNQNKEVYSKDDIPDVKVKKEIIKKETSWQKKLENKQPPQRRSERLRHDQNFENEKERNLDDQNKTQSENQNDQKPETQISQINSNRHIKELLHDKVNMLQKNNLADFSSSDSEKSYKIYKGGYRSSLPFTMDDQIALHKRNNIFKGVLKDKVCQICEKPNDVQKCKGRCNGYYHIKCALDIVFKNEGLYDESEDLNDERKTKNDGSESFSNLDETKSNSNEDSGFVFKSENKVKNNFRDFMNISSDSKCNLSDTGGIAHEIVSSVCEADSIVNEDRKNESLNTENDCTINESKSRNANEAEGIVIEAVSNEAFVNKIYNPAESCNQCNSFELEESKPTSEISGKRLSLEEQIDLKMKEVMENVDNEVYFVDSMSDASSDENLIDTKVEIKHVTADQIEYGACNFKCKYCVENVFPPCFVCKQNISKKGSNIRQKCSLFQCGRFYHLECLKSWPQTQWSLILNTKNKGVKNSADTFVCPLHFCHTCISDDPRAAISRTTSDKVVKCLRCPATYHTSIYCVPAGTVVLTTSQIICPRHLGEDQMKSGKPNRKFRAVNTAWCFICSQGGDIICCDKCPTSVHASCINVNLNEDDTFICEDCETGRFPLYDNIVWVKLGKYRWWPSLTLFPNEVPENINNLPHAAGEFVVRFLGTNDHYWVGRGRVFLYEEGDKGYSAQKKNSVDTTFQKAVEEAAILHKIKQDYKAQRELAQKTIQKPPPFIKIKVNKPVGNVKQFDGNISNSTPCGCDPSLPYPCGPDSNCLNRLLLTECDPSVCPAGAKCCNQNFQKRIYPPLVPYKTEGRGWGLKTLAPIEKGQFVIEYVGELIDAIEYQRRIKKMHEKKEENYYFLTITNYRMIDAGPKGNVARFMNHSCQPNCETQKWTVCGDTRVGLFALHDIPADSEVTFNYNLECVGKEKQVCKCGAQNCSGFIGLKAKQDERKKKTFKLKKIKKKRQTLSPQINLINDPCFSCGKKGNVIACQNKICSKFYHLKCVNLNDLPEGKWVCPWHNCNICTKRTIRCCVKCLNSFCPVHSEGNVRYDKLLGFVCAEHDPINESTAIELNSAPNLTRIDSSQETKETDVTSTTSDEYDTSLQERLLREKVAMSTQDLITSQEECSENNVTSTPLKTNMNELLEISQDETFKKEQNGIHRTKKRKGKSKKSMTSRPMKKIKLDLEDEISKIPPEFMKPQSSLSLINNINCSQNEVILSSTIPTRHLRASKGSDLSDIVPDSKFIKRHREYEKDLPIRKRAMPRCQTSI